MSDVKRYIVNHSDRSESMVMATDYDALAAELSEERTLRREVAASFGRYKDEAKAERDQLRARVAELERDAGRLDFMLQGYRTVIVESLPGNRKDVYVEEGFMGDKQHPAVSHRGKWVAGSQGDLALKRRAIDAAMAAQAER